MTPKKQADEPLKPFSIAIVDESPYMRMGYLSELQGWRRYLTPHVYANSAEVYHALDAGRTHDIWLFNVDIRSAGEVRALEERVARVASAWLYSRKPLPLAHGDDAILQEPPTGDGLRSLVCREIATLRRRWIGRLRLPIDFWKNPTLRCKVPGRGWMSLEQIFADHYIRAPKGTKPQLEHAYRREAHLLLRYYRAFMFDPDVGGNWNRGARENERRSLLSALSHRSLRPDDGESPANVPELVERIKCELGSYCLSDSAVQRVAELLKEPQPNVTPEGRWEWPEGWKAAKLDLTYNFRKRLAELRTPQGKRVRPSGALEVTLPSTSGEWIAFAKNTGVCDAYWCDPQQLQAGFEALLTQVEGEQLPIIHLKAGDVGEQTQRLLTTTIHVEGMDLPDPDKLQIAQGSTTSGTGFQRVFSSLGEYGRCYVRSPSWDGVWHELPEAIPVERDSVERFDREGTTFVFEFVAPYASQLQGEYDGE